MWSVEVKLSSSYPVGIGIGIGPTWPADQQTSYNNLNSLNSWRSLLIPPFSSTLPLIILFFSRNTANSDFGAYVYHHDSYNHISIIRSYSMFDVRFNSGWPDQFPFQACSRPYNLFADCDPSFTFSSKAILSQSRSRKREKEKNQKGKKIGRAKKHMYARKANPGSAGRWQMLGIRKGKDDRKRSSCSASSGNN